ncbi:hypothetical protein HDU89_003556 [Geranomyces variabilis]|nr:hypothetical protein HDU89_003556 [Geranomyces variabilis]
MGLDTDLSDADESGNVRKVRVQAHVPTPSPGKKNGTRAAPSRKNPCAKKDPFPMIRQGSTMPAAEGSFAVRNREKRSVVQLRICARTGDCRVGQSNVLVREPNGERGTSAQCHVRKRRVEKRQVSRGSQIICPCNHIRAREILVLAEPYANPPCLVPLWAIVHEKVERAHESEATSKNVASKSDKFSVGPKSFARTATSLLILVLAVPDANPPWLVALRAIVDEKIERAQESEEADHRGP